VINLICVYPIKDINIIKEMRLYLRKQSIRNEFLFIFGINIGLRISDILKLKFEDIVLPDLITIKDYIVIKELKNNKTNKFYINDTIKEVLLSYLKDIKNIKLDDYIFKSKKGANAPITRQQAYRVLNYAAEMLGLVKRNKKGVIIEGEIGTHTLRKTFGYHAYNNGVSLELLQSIFNHGSKADTLRYIGNDELSEYFISKTGVIDDNLKKEVYFQQNIG
jgi:integrase